jgi:hypothetical protein
MLHACVGRFDVMGGRGNILGWDGEVNKAMIDMPSPIHALLYLSPSGLYMYSAHSLLHTVGN